MMQWVKVHRNNNIINPMLCNNSGAIHLVQPGLTAGRQTGNQAGNQIKILCVVSEISKIYCNWILLCALTVLID